jgi:prepilin-type processing-associated H-X9-DG protein
MKAVQEVHGELGVKLACDALGLPRATWYRAQARLVLKTPGSESETRPRKASPRELTIAERGSAVDLLHEPRFFDICSQRTMYRILDSCGEVRERRDQLHRPTYTRPELLATGPNQVWSWDITRLKGPRKWTYFHLYVIIDIFSRKVAPGVRVVAAWFEGPRGPCTAVRSRVGRGSCCSCPVGQDAPHGGRAIFAFHDGRRGRGRHTPCPTQRSSSCA